ncbi:MAG: helix-turn-helix domain-containing protein [Gammaproteobacteria bacterium]
MSGPQPPAVYDVYVKIGYIEPHFDVYIINTLKELGDAISTRRQALGLKQGAVAAQAGIAQESLSRFERGHAAEFGVRKLIAVLAVLGLELQFTEAGASGSLDELRRERSTS